MVSAPFRRELHVAGPGGFLAGRRNLLGEIRRGEDTLAVLDVEVGDEDNLQPIADTGVRIDDLGHRVDQLDDELGHEIAGCRFATENDGPRRHQSRFGSSLIRR